MVEEKTNWDSERAAYKAWEYETLGSVIPLPWAGNMKETKEAKRLLEETRYGVDVGQLVGGKEVISGKQRAREWLRRKAQTEGKKEEKQKEDKEKRRNKVNKIMARIHATQDKLLSNCWNQLPEECPLKKEGSEKFFFAWHNIDGRIFPSIDPQAEMQNSIIMYEFTYERFLKSAEYTGGLIEIENFKPDSLKEDLYEEHVVWVERKADTHYRGRWFHDRRDCEKNIKQTLSKQPLHLFVVAAAEYLRTNHMLNQIPLNPTIDEVKQTLDWKFPALKNDYSEAAMKAAIVLVRKFLFLEEKGRGPNQL